MSKQPTDARREVTAEDLETIDSAISYHEVLGGFLYRSRIFLGELSKVEKHYRGLKEAVAVVEEQGRRVNAELEAANARLAAVQAQEVEKRKEVAALTAEAEEKRRELSAYSEAIDRIVGKVAA